MATAVSSIYIDAPLRVVWDAVADLGSHAEWMADAESVTVEGDAGPGARMSVETRIGPVRTIDLLQVTEWEEQRLLGVRHVGLVTGAGRFELTPMEGRTRLRWSEELSFPLRAGGVVTAVVARPVLGWVWRRNLRTLAASLESP